MTAALGGIWAELDAMLALIDREDELARQAKERACDGATFAEAWAWLREQEATA